MNARFSFSLSRFRVAFAFCGLIVFPPMLIRIWASAGCAHTKIAVTASTVLIAASSFCGRQNRRSPAGIPALLFCLILAGCTSDPVADKVRAKDYAGLLELAQSGDEDLECRAMKALGWVRHPDAAKAQVEVIAVTGCSWKLRTEPAWRLVEQDLKQYIPGLLPYLEDPKEDVRWNIARVLGHFGDPAARPALVQCQADDNPFVAAWCAWSVCRIDEGDCDRPNMNLVNGEPAP